MLTLHNKKLVTKILKVCACIVYETSKLFGLEGIYKFWVPIFFREIVWFGLTEGKVWCHDEKTYNLPPTGTLLYNQKD